MSTFPASGYYIIANFPFKTQHPSTEMKLTLDRIGDPSNNTYRLYCQMRCDMRSWDQGTLYSISLVIEYYNDAGVKLSEQTVINKKGIYKPNVSPSKLWGKGKMYNWNINTDKQSYSDALTSARALGLIQMSYSAAKNTASAEGIQFWSPNLMAGEPWGIRYISDNPPNVVYQPQTLAYVVRPTNKNYNTWPAGFGRTDSDQGVQFVMSPPQGAAYFIGRVEWYSDNTLKGQYRFPQDGAEIPDDQKFDSYSKVYYKNGSWTDGAFAWEKVNGTWEKRNIYNKSNNTWNKKN